MTSNASISSLIRMAPSCAVGARADGGGHGDRRGQRRNQANVEVGEAKPRCLHTDLCELVVSLHRHQCARRDGQEADDDDGFRDDGPRTCPQLIAGDETHQLGLVVHEDVDGRLERSAVELGLFPLRLSSRHDMCSAFGSIADSAAARRI